LHIAVYGVRQRKNCVPNLENEDESDFFGGKRTECFP